MQMSDYWAWVISSGTAEMVMCLFLTRFSRDKKLSFFQDLKNTVVILLKIKVVICSFAAVSIITYLFLRGLI
ncbi:hypothetical protein B4923_15480 [Brenneria roseae subsp. americana]|uniref:Uncharacterized protein n=1 Tax=Brenneria roseae subsp. americana TaxID=1508507 RepID=A0A2U1TND8_9GAMM|nr:hypothetical protein B4923_15480 [Brenneria roseae subsp. americana]